MSPSEEPLLGKQSFIGHEIPVQNEIHEILPLHVHIYGRLTL
jgi:hypothetical protein